MRGGSPAVLAQLGLAPVSFEDVISARPPTTEEFAALELHAEVSILHTFRVARAVDGKPVEVQVMAKAGHRYELRYRWTVA
jgi:GntR family transcriptional regulator